MVFVGHSVGFDVQVRKVAVVHMRDDFEIRTYNNDIALIKLDRPVRWSDGVRPLCLPETDEDYAGQEANVVGWGRVKYNGQLPGRLREATIPILTQHQCRYPSRIDRIPYQLNKLESLANRKSQIQFHIFVQNLG